MAERHTVTYFDGKRLSRLVFDDCSEPTESELISMLGGDTVELICGSPDAPESFFGYRIGRFAGEDNEDGTPAGDSLEAYRLYTRSCKDISVETERVFDFIEPFIGLDLVYLMTGKLGSSAEADDINNAAVNAGLLRFSGRYGNHVFTPAELTELIKGNEIYFEYINSAEEWVRLSGRLLPVGFTDDRAAVTADFVTADDYPELPSAGNTVKF